jgi:hypothetical protein
MADDGLDDTDLHDVPDDQLTAEDLATLRRQAAEGRKARTEAETLRKQMAFTAAGIDTANPLGQFFLDNYAGDIDPTAIRTRALELHVPVAGVDPTQVEAAGREAEAERINAASRSLGTAAHSPGPKPEDPLHTRAAAQANFDKMRMEGANQEEAMASSMALFLAGALAGDNEVVWDGWSADDLQRARYAS